MSQHKQWLSTLFLLVALLGISLSLPRAGAAQTAHGPSAGIFFIPWCSARLTNGTFETGAITPWVQLSSHSYSLLDNLHPHTGIYNAWLGGYNNGTDTLYQTVSIPSSAGSATLTFWWQMTTQETTHSVDYFRAQVLNTSGAVLGTLQTLSDGNAANTWTKSTYSLLAYRGQTVRIAFQLTNNSSRTTSFFLDDVSLNTCITLPIFKPADQ